MNRKSCYIQGLFNIWAKGRVIVLVGLCMLFTDLNTMMAQDIAFNRKNIDIRNCKPQMDPIDVQLRYSENQLDLSGCPCFYTRESAQRLIQFQCESRQNKTTSRGAIAGQDLSIAVDPGEEKTITIFCIEETVLMEYLDHYCGGL